MPAQYELTDLPEGIVLCDEGNQHDESIIKWSGSYPIPQIGSSVKINFNELGTGKVEGYFTEHGYCGVYVRLDKAPDWKVKAHKGTRYEGIAMVFGQETSLIHDPDEAINRLEKENERNVGLPPNPQEISFHSDCTVTIWNPHTKSPLRTNNPSQAALATLTPDMQDLVCKHCGVSANN